MGREDGEKEGGRDEERKGEGKQRKTWRDGRGERQDDDRVKKVGRQV